MQGKEWAQAAFHASFGTASPNPPILDGTTGRCSNCHVNVKPVAAGFSTDHSGFTATSAQDCNTCHAWPGTGTASAPNWLGATGAPALVTLTNWGYGPPTTNSVTFPHPRSSTYTSCAQCHAGTTYNTIIDYNHDGLTSNVTINGVAAPATLNLGTSQYNISTNPTFCVACHTSNSQWVTRGASSSISATTTSGSTTVTTASTAALTQGMSVSGTGFAATVTITAIATATSFTVSTAANATGATTLTVTHKSITQATIGSHQGSTIGEDCTSCHYVGGNQSLRPPTPGVFGTGSISGG